MSPIMSCLYLCFILKVVIDLFFFFFFNDTATTEIYTLSLHDALPIYRETAGHRFLVGRQHVEDETLRRLRSEEHTSELQSPCNLVCRLLLEKKKKKEFTLSSRRTLQTHS